MSIHLLDQTVHLDIYIDASDAEFEDDVCFRFVKDCPEDKRYFAEGRRSCT